MRSSSIHETCGYTDDRGFSKISTGFPCFVCGTGFALNKKRIQHLEEGLHGSMYDTGSPKRALKYLEWSFDDEGGLVCGICRGINRRKCCNRGIKTGMIE